MRDILLYCIVVKGLPSTEVLEKSRGLLRHEFSIPPSNPNGSTPHLLYAFLSSPIRHSDAQLLLEHRL